MNTSNPQLWESSGKYHITVDVGTDKHQDGANSLMMKAKELFPKIRVYSTFSTVDSFNAYIVRLEFPELENDYDRTLEDAMAYVRKVTGNYNLKLKVMRIVRKEYEI